MWKHFYIIMKRSISRKECIRNASRFDHYSAAEQLFLASFCYRVGVRGAHYREVWIGLFFGVLALLLLVAASKPVELWT